MVDFLDPVDFDFRFPGLFVLHFSTHFADLGSLGFAFPDSGFRLAVLEFLGLLIRFLGFPALRVVPPDSRSVVLSFLLVLIVAFPLSLVPALTGWGCSEWIQWLLFLLFMLFYLLFILLILFKNKGIEGLLDLYH
jgi:hypothetical protein